MKKITLSLCVFSSAISLALAGTEYTGKEMRQTTVPEECFYADQELDVSLWGTYAFAGTDQRNIGGVLPGFALRKNSIHRIGWLVWRFCTSGADAFGIYVLPREITLEGSPT